MDLSTVKLGKVMMHDIPRGGNAAEPILTDAPVQLDRDLLDYFSDKLATSLRTRGVDAITDATADATVRNAVTDFLRAPRHLVEGSKLIAQHLSKIQNGNNPPGLLTVIASTVDGLPALAIMKLEREQGIRFQIRRSGGHAMVDLELLRQLTLTNKTKVFKTALLMLARPGDPLSMCGRVSDNQRGTADGRGVADFFFRDFLGCELAKNPARATREFVEAVTEFLNTDTISPRDKGRYQLALAAELDKNTLDIMPAQFAADYIKAEHRRTFAAKLADLSVDMNVGFQKDPSLVKYENFRLVFESGMTLVGAGEDLRERVRFREDNEPPGVDVFDPIKTLSGK